MYACPACSTQVQDFDLACPRCDIDLRPIAVANELPDARFNRALEAAESGDWLTATLQLHALLAARMADVDAWVLLGTLYARRGAWSTARECWNSALIFQPGEARATQGLETLHQIVQS